MQNRPAGVGVAWAPTPIGDDQTRRPLRYSVARSVARLTRSIVRTACRGPRSPRRTQPAAYEAAVEAAIAAGANRVQGVSFDLADRDATVRRAREAAFNDARAKAEQHARLAGVQLGPVLTIVEGDNAGSGPKPVSAPAAARAAAPDTPIEAGAGTIRLTVQITFEMR
ncbi:MAG: SIMPL domain-containing protein [Actinobacteria bacterium]|nr:SIMPL domain-containing protein [Actinomycetota bacterium]